MRLVNNHITHFFTAEFHRVHAEFREVFLVAPAVRRGHGGRLC